jgi:hypothetical protein
VVVSLHHFRVQATSRAEHNIVAALQPISLCTEIRTGITVTESSSSDIHFYLHQRFAEIAEAHPCSIATPWPEPAILLTLTKQAAGLFIWAKTVVEFVDESNPPNQLDRILRGDLGDDADMDKLYELIMQHGVGRQPDAGALERFNAITAAIVLAKVPLRREDLSRILGDSTISRDIPFTLNALKSVIDSSDYIRIRHQDFADFLTARSPKKYLINQVVENRRLALGCLRIMNGERGLEFNKCNMQTSYARNDEMAYEDTISADLLYACRFWVDHLQATVFEGGDVLEGLQTLMYEKLLFWLEILGIMNEVHLASRSLLLARNWINVSSQTPL